MNKQQLAAKIWRAANEMRSKIEANEYKDYILGFIFYKFLSDKELKLLKTEGMTDAEITALTEEDTDAVNHIKNRIGYFIAYENIFSTWIERGSDFSVDNVRTALSAFSRHINEAHKKVFNDIFKTLETGLSKLGDTTASQTKAIIGLLDLIKTIPMDGKQDYDVLGFIYEYLISNFAANAGKKAGEFYTPHEVSLLMSEIIAEHLKGESKIEIYDPTSGSGSLLINIGKSVSKHIKDENSIKYYAQELKENTYNLTRMNLVMRGILPDNIIVRRGDTLEEDWPYFEEEDPPGTYEPLHVNAVVSNPPYSQKWEPKDKKNDPRYKDFGLAPKTKADYAFLLHELFHLKSSGIMTIVLPHGVLFRGDPDGADGEGKIRKNLIEKNHIDAIIGLPPNAFFGTGIATIIMVLRQKRDRDDVLFIDASKGFIKVGKNNLLRASDIKKIADTVANRLDISKFSRKISRDEIRNNNWNLNIPRYVDSSDSPEIWDIYATMFGGIPKTELSELQEYWSAFPSLQADLFNDTGTPFVSITTDNVKQAILENADIQAYLSSYSRAFSSFDEYLHNELIDKMCDINISKHEVIISDDIFTRLESIQIIDKYKAYQALNDEWVKTAIDLEIIQTEGFEAVKVVDPNMVIKKKDNVESEVQDGWIGRVIPFDLIQSTLLKSESDALRLKEARLTEIVASIEETLESMSEDEKDEYKDAFNEDNTAFASKGLNIVLKEISSAKQTYSEDSVEYKFISVGDLLIEQKKLKKEVKNESAALHMLTKETIENLTDEQALEMLDMKWIKPVVSAMNKLPQEVINNLVEKVTALAEKYSVTYVEVTDKITSAKNEVISLIDKLQGNEFDMKGLVEFQSLLRGDEND